MSDRRVALLASILLAGLVGACAVVDLVDPRYDTVNRSLSKARNESILLNIIRAAHEWPLSFTTIPQVNPSAQNVTTTGLPSFNVGPSYKPPSVAGGPVERYTLGSPFRAVLFGNQNNLSNQLTVSSNFSVSSLETGTFYNGLLSPVSLHDLNYFIRQGYSRELLFWLFADTVQVTIGGRTIGFQYNPPDDYGCPEHEPRRRCFREFVEIATITGLSVESKTIRPGARPKGGDGDSTDGAANPRGGGAGGGGAGGGGGGGGGGGAREYSRFCFDPVLAERGRRAMDPDRLRIMRAEYLDAFRPSPICGSRWTPGQSEDESLDHLQFHVGPLKFKILPRSTNSIYQLLGKILREEFRVRREAAEGVEVVELRAYLPPGREDERLPVLSTTRDDRKLLNVVPAAGQDCFVHTWFIDGDYCIPEHGSSNTKRIFALLAELLALKTQASELAITPAVRIVQ
jgi:uncharacterized membrane protein YgcG